MSNTAAKLDILIDIQAKLGELLKVQHGMREAKAEAAGFGALLRQGLGIGTGMELARRGIEMVKGAITASVGEAFRLAGQLNDVSQNLSISTDALQVLAELVKDNGGEFETLTQGIVTYRAQLALARNGNEEASRTFRDLHLSADALSRLPLELQIEKLARAITASKDQTSAFDSAVKILGSRNAPKLMQSLRELAKDGYRALDSAMKESGRIMESETIDRLDRAEKQLSKFKRSLAIHTGEAIGFWTKMWDSMAARPLATIGAAASAPLYWSGVLKNDPLGQVFNGLPSEAPPPENTGPVRATSEEMIAARLQFTSEEIDRTNNFALATELEKRPRLISLLQEQERLQNELLKLKYADVIAMKEGDEDNSMNATKEQLVQLREKAKLEAEIAKNRSQQRTVAGQAPSEFTRNKEQFLGVNDPTVNTGFMSPMQGALSGAMQWATEVGSVGQQVAGTINSTIGESVRGVSSELANWAVTGKMSGDTLAQVGMSIFTGWVTNIVTMGVQWLITEALMATGILSLDALQSALLVNKTVEVNAANAATLPANTANAAAASVGSFGIAAALGLVALLAVMAMFGGFREHGGAVSAGVPYIVGERRPEMFIPSGAGRIVPTTESFTRNSPGLGGSAAVGASKPRMLLMRPSTQQEFDALRRLPDWDVQVVDTMMRHRGTLING